MVRERNKPKQACRERNLSMVRERNLNKVPERVLTTTPDPPFMNTISIISRILVQLQMHLCCVFSQCSNLKRLQECQFIICYKFHKKKTHLTIPVFSITSTGGSPELGAERIQKHFCVLLPENTQITILLQNLQLINCVFQAMKHMLVNRVHATYKKHKGIVQSGTDNEVQHTT